MSVCYDTREHVFSIPFSSAKTPLQPFRLKPDAKRTDGAVEVKRSVGCDTQELSMSGNEIYSANDPLMTLLVVLA